MSTTPHPPIDALLLFVTEGAGTRTGTRTGTETGTETGIAGTGPGEAGTLTRTHVIDCAPCRQRLGELRGFLNTVRDELLETRPECPSPDELARLPPGAEHDDPHLQQCPLCRQEVRMLFEVESAARLGTEVGGLAASGLFYRPSPVVQGGGFAYQRGTGLAEWAIAVGEEKEMVVAGTTVRLRCADAELIVEVTAGGESLALVLGNEVLEKQVPLAVGEQRLAAGGWKRVRVVVG